MIYLYVMNKPSLAVRSPLDALATVHHAQSGGRDR